MGVYLAGGAFNLALLLAGVFYAALHEDFDDDDVLGVVGVGFAAFVSSWVGTALALVALLFCGVYALGRRLS